MSIDVHVINIGAVANDGTGDPIRNAFANVNSNFANIDNRISTGNVAQVYASITVTGETLVSNTSTTTQTLTVHNTANIVTANITNLSTTTITANTVTSGNLNVTKDAVINGNLTVLGNTTSISAADLVVKDSLINLHANADLSPLTSDDGKDVGLIFNYYKTSDKQAALVWANDSQALEFYASGTQTSGNTFTGTYGNVKVGSLFAANTSANTSIIAIGGITTGNIVVTSNAYITTALVNKLQMGSPISGRNVQGSVYLTGGDSVYINGSPVQTAASSFSGGQVTNPAWFLSQLTANSTIASTSTTTGAIVVDGGVGVSGNINAGAITNTPITGSSGAFTTLSVSSSFSANNVTFIGGNVTAMDNVGTTNANVTNFSSSNVAITGGNITVYGITANAATITSGNITGISNFSATAATITGGSATGLSNVSTTNLTATNGLIISGVGARITGDFSNATVTNRVIVQTSTSNSGTNISVMPKGSISPGGLTASLKVEDSNSVGGAGAIGVFELYQDTDVRIQSAIRGAGTYLPLTMYTGGTKAAQVNTNHDFTVFNTGGTAAVTFGANGSIINTGSCTLNSGGSVGAGLASLKIQGPTSDNNWAGQIQLVSSNGTTVNWQIGASSGGFITANNGTPVTTVDSTGLTVAGLVSLTRITKSGTNGAGDIGQAGNTFATVYATTFSGVSTTAKYADLAEMYTSDKDYAPGTVVVFGGDQEVTTTTVFADHRVAGVVSTDPAYLMNAMTSGVAVALRGRVPVKVMGTVNKGDLLVASDIPGHASSVGNDKSYGPCVFAKAITAHTGNGKGTVEAVIL